MLKVLNFLKVLSVILFLGVLLLVYAYLPVMIDIQPDSQDIQVRKETFFYYSIAAFVMINLVLFVFQRLTEPKLMGEGIKAWMRGLSFIINIYLAMLVGFVGVINNATHINPSGYAYLNYLGPILLVVWGIGLAYIVFSGKYKW